MKVKLDENMPAALKELLRQAGHDALTVGDEAIVLRDIVSSAEVKTKQQQVSPLPQFIIHQSAISNPRFGLDPSAGSSL